MACLGPLPFHIVIQTVTDCFPQSTVACLRTTEYISTVSHRFRCFTSESRDLRFLSIGRRFMASASSTVAVNIPGPLVPMLAMYLCPCNPVPDRKCFRKQAIGPIRRPCLPCPKRRHGEPFGRINGPQTLPQPMGVAHGNQNHGGL